MGPHQRRRGWVQRRRRLRTARTTVVHDTSGAGDAVCTSDARRESPGTDLAPGSMLPSLLPSHPQQRMHTGQMQTPLTRPKTHTARGWTNRAQTVAAPHGCIAPCPAPTSACVTLRPGLRRAGCHRAMEWKAPLFRLQAVTAHRASCFVCTPACS